MPNPDYDVAIVGAGFSGMYLLHRCRKLGLTARIWEAGEGVGGTWYWNRYPGARCDVPSLQYSFKFDEDLQQDWNWTERYATQPEILSYAEHVAERFALTDGITFGRRVESAIYDDAGTWTLTAQSGDTLTARFCVMATGCLSAPNWPKIDGFDDFSGNVFHTALWPHEGTEFTGQRVAVIGTGSSGIQSIPLIAQEAAQVTVFQRTPNYTIPAWNRPLDAEEIAATKSNYAAFRNQAMESAIAIAGDFHTGSVSDDGEDERQARLEQRWAEGGLLFLAAYGDIMKDQDANDYVANFVKEKIRAIVKDPETAEALCPPNIIGGKRLCVDTDYYATFNRSNVELIDIHRQPIDHIDANGVVSGGVRYEVDAIVIATGFDAMTGSLLKVDIRGRGGASLREVWKDGAKSYLGLAMAGFPNLFTVTGPGSPSVLTNMIPSIEQHVEWISDCMALVLSAGHTQIETTDNAEALWWQHVQDLGYSGLKSRTPSWYLGANIEGKPRAFLPYYGGFPAYREKCDAVVANGYEGFELS